MDRAKPSSPPQPLPAVPDTLPSSPFTLSQPPPLLLSSPSMEASFIDRLMNKEDDYLLRWGGMQWHRKTHNLQT
ncbi:hypothetical protein OIU84_005887 [Salix udensis]|uniref:Uncharacterized protein n=1 Tax=Salix udensis TaxID=889485 RepID=A0AAD6JYT2_9ROSI|nr:hypothetical protein OIU84_005887 [Salix udensis]